MQNNQEYGSERIRKCFIFADMYYYQKKISIIDTITMKFLILFTDELLTQTKHLFISQKNDDGLDLIVHMLEILI